MNMTKIALGTLALSCAAFLHAEFENPALTKHSDDVTFYVQFENEGIASLSTGKNTPFRCDGKAEYAPSFSGKALKPGAYFNYKGQDNADLASTGTAIYWVALEKDFTVPEKGFNALTIYGNKWQYSLFSGRQGNAPHLISYVQYAASLKIEHVTCTVYDVFGLKKWKPGEWHMIAVTWRPGTFSTMFDGVKVKHSLLKVPMTGNTEEIRIGFSDKPMDIPMLMDEVIILKKELTEAELKEIYDLSVKQFADKK